MRPSHLSGGRTFSMSQTINTLRTTMAERLRNWNLTRTCTAWCVRAVQVYTLLPRSGASICPPVRMRVQRTGVRWTPVRGTTPVWHTKVTICLFAFCCWERKHSLPCRQPMFIEEGPSRRSIHSQRCTQHVQQHLRLDLPVSLRSLSFICCDGLYEQQLLNPMQVITQLAATRRAELERLRAASASRSRSKSERSVHDFLAYCRGSYKHEGRNRDTRAPTQQPASDNAPQIYVVPSTPPAPSWQQNKAIAAMCR